MVSSSFGYLELDFELLPLPIVLSSFPLLVMATYFKMGVYFQYFEGRMAAFTVAEFIAVIIEVEPSWLKAIDFEGAVANSLLLMDYCIHLYYQT
jgi:hypothetical protein